MLVYGQETYGYLIKSNKSKEKSVANGDKLIQFNNYSLNEIIAYIYKLPSEFISYDDENYKKLMLDLKIWSDKKLNESELINKFNYLLKKELNLKIYLKYANRKVYIIYCSDTKRLKKCKKNEKSLVTIINRTYKGSCITSKKLVQQISSWYGIYLINELNQFELYNFEISHTNSLEELIEELYYNYSIDIIGKMKKMKIITVKNIK